MLSNANLHNHRAVCDIHRKAPTVRRFTEVSAGIRYIPIHVQRSINKPPPSMPVQSRSCYKSIATALRKPHPSNRSQKSIRTLSGTFHYPCAKISYIQKLSAGFNGRSYDLALSEPSRQPTQSHTPSGAPYSGSMCVRGWCAACALSRRSEKAVAVGIVASQRHEKNEGRGRWARTPLERFPSIIIG